MGCPGQGDLPGSLAIGERVGGQPSIGAPRDVAGPARLVEDEERDVTAGRCECGDEAGDEDVARDCARAMKRDIDRLLIGCASRSRRDRPLVEARRWIADPEERSIESLVVCFEGE